MKKLLLVVLLFSMSIPSVAQQGTVGLNGLKFVAPLQFAIGTDNNFLVDRTDPNQKLLVLSLSPSVQPGAPDIRPKILDDKFLMLTLPRIAYQNDSRRHEFTITWVPEFEVYKQNPDQNSMNQEATAAFGYSITRNLQIAAADNFVTSKDPARALSNVFLLLPRSRYFENSIHGAIDYQPNQVTNIGIKYDNSYSKFGQGDPFQVRLLDSISSGYSLVFTRMLRPKHRIKATYSFFKVKPINEQEEFDAGVDNDDRDFVHPINSGSVEYRWSMNPNTVVEFSGGAIKLDTGLNYIFRGNFHRRIANFWVGAGYTRSLAFQAGATGVFAQGVVSNGFYDIISARFRGQPSRNTAVLVEATLTRDVSGRITDSTQAAMGRVRLDYRLSDRTVVFGNWDAFQQSRNVYVAAPLTRNRFSVGFEFSLSSEADRRANRLNEDTQYVALTDHQRRRKTPEDN